jgi:hypothetical protein
VSANNLSREAHNRHFSTFTKHSAYDFENDFAPAEPGCSWNVDDDRPDNDAGHLVLDRQRWQLPDHPAFVSHQDFLVRHVVDSFPEMATDQLSFGKMRTIPGLPTRPVFYNVDLDLESGKVLGLFLDQIKFLQGRTTVHPSSFSSDGNQPFHSDPVIHDRPDPPGRTLGARLGIGLFGLD